MTDFLLRILLWRDVLGDGGTIEALRLPRCETPGEVLLFLALLVGGALLIRWGYRRDVGWVPPRRKTALTALRCGALAVVLFIATGAVLDVVRRFDGVGTVMLLVDRSQSMALVDRREGEDLVRVSELLGDPARAATATRHDLLAAALADPDLDPVRALKDRFKVEVYGFGEGVGLTPLAAGDDGAATSVLPAPDERATQLGAALADAARRARGRRLDAVIVATDGGWNRGEDPVEVASSLGAPVVALGVGAPQSKDLEIPFLFSEDIVFKNDRFVLDVRVRQRGYSGRTITLVVRRTDEAGREEVMKEEQLTLGEEREFNHTVELVPDVQGVFTFTAELLPQPEEANTVNNRKSRANVQVVDKKLRVLAVEDVPRWDFRFLRGLLEADKQRVQPTFVLRQGDLQIDSRHMRFLRQIPANTTTLLRETDCIILGDIAPDFFTPEEIRRIEEWVRVDGGGLVLVAGRRFMPAAWAGTPLDLLLPVEPAPQPAVTVADELARTIKDGFRPVVTPEGSRWAALRFAADPGENQLKWRESEPLRWFHPVVRAKSGASVLLAHPTERSGDDPMPILAVQRYGRGQVAWVGSDETWRWRFRPGVAQHRRLWGQLTSSLGMAHLLGTSSRVQIETDASEYAIGDRATVIARVLDADFNPSREDEVTVLVERDLVSESIVLAARRDQPGMFTGEWIPGAVGRHRLHMGISDPGAAAPEDAGAERIVTVVEPQLELDDGGMREDLLAQLATASEGVFLPLHRAGEIRDFINARERQGVQKREEATLWNAPGVLVLLVLLLGIEWWYRKQWDML